MILFRLLTIACLSAWILGCVHSERVGPRDSIEGETYSDHVARLKHATVLGREMAYIDEGQGAPIVLMHGIPTSSWMYRKMIPRLVENGYRVIAPDLMGMGASEKIDDEESLLVPMQASYVLTLLVDTLELEEWTHVVHDFGGPVTWEMMEDPRFRIRRLIVLDTFAFQSGWNAGLNFVTRTAMQVEAAMPFNRISYCKGIRGMVEDPAIASDTMVDGYVDPLMEGADFTYRCLYFSSNDLETELPRYQRSLARYAGSDVRIIWGRHDPFLSADKQLDRFRELLDVPRDRVLILEDARHLVADEAPQRIVRFIGGP